MNEYGYSEEVANRAIYTYMITGVRGNGKTVLMTEIRNAIKEYDDWETIELSTSQNLLATLAQTLYEDNRFAKILRQGGGFQIMGFGVQVNGDEDQAAPQIAIKDALERLKKHGKKLLVCIDEIITNNHVKEFEKSGLLEADIIQNEISPLNTDRINNNYFMEKSCIIEAYSPLCRMNNAIRNDEGILEICKELNVDIGRLILKWHIANGIHPIFTSKKPARIISNTRLDFTLEEHHIEYINGLNMKNTPKFMFRISFIKSVTFPKYCRSFIRKHTCADWSGISLRLRGTRDS